MSDPAFRLKLCLPAQGASEVEATLIEWFVAEGDRFEKGAVLAQAESAKSVFDFQAPCAGTVIRLDHAESETVSLTEPVLEIETTDPAMRQWTSPVAPEVQPVVAARPIPASPANGQPSARILGLGGYLPERIVTNSELVQGYPEVTADYVYQVTGIRQRRWAAEGEKPSGMALAASLEAIRKAGIATKQIDAIILATTTPDVAIPSTACILQDQLSLHGALAFDLNAACSGWLYAVGLAESLIRTGMARTVLTVGVDVQSRLLNPADRSAYFIFGDGAGAAVIAAADHGHRICRSILAADPHGIETARRDSPGYLQDHGTADPWIRLDGQALFRLATESFSEMIGRAIAETGWTADQPRWIVPHQANGRILKAAAKRSGVEFERFFVNVERVGNTSSASIPLALIEAEPDLRAGDKLVLCSVGAGMTTAAVTVEW